jgi:uncharacterized protein with ATP-grasp and redox domains
MTERPQFPECKDCLLRLAGGAAQATVGDDAAQEAAVEQAAKRVLRQGMEQGLRSPAIATLMLAEVRRLTGVDDPYADFKRQEMEQAAKVMEALGPQNIPTGLRGLVALSALGNSLDFFQDAGQALDGLQAKLEQGIVFHRDDLRLFEDRLESSSELVLFLSDNAGEIYFDLPLIEHLRKRAGRVVLVVKGGPAQNDLTAEDLRISGLISLVGELADTGADAAGLDWEMVSPEFMALLNLADLVVAKGMANYLSTLERPLPCPGFFIFKLKCKPLRDLWDAPPESFWAAWSEPGRS